MAWKVWEGATGVLGIGMDVDMDGTSTAQTWGMFCDVQRQVARNR